MGGGAVYEGHRTPRGIATPVLGREVIYRLDVITCIAGTGGPQCTESGRTCTCSGRATPQGSPAGSPRVRNAPPMYSPLDSGPTVYPENTVGDGRELLYLDGISATWHDVQSKDRQSDRRVTFQNSLITGGRRSRGRYGSAHCAAK